MKEVRQYKKLKYVLRFPKGYNGESMPVIIHIHGAGGRGSDISVIENHFIFGALESLCEERFIVVSPQCYADTWFEIFGELLDFISMIREEPYTDKSRVYLMGASMGGYTVWQTAMTRPEYFAAIVPVCGGGMYWNAGRLKNVPVWAHHGMLDEDVFFEESVKMVNAVNKTGGHARFTAYENVRHNSWENAYGNPEVYDWLLEHTK